MKTLYKKKYRGREFELGDNLFSERTTSVCKPFKSSRFPDAVYYDGVHLFLNSMIEKIDHFEIQGCFYKGKWRQDTFKLSKGVAGIITCREQIA